MHFLEVNFPHKHFTSVGASNNQTLRTAAKSVELFVSLTRSKIIRSKFELKNVHVCIWIWWSVALRICGTAIAPSNFEIVSFLTDCISFPSILISIWVDSAQWREVVEMDSAIIRAREQKLVFHLESLRAKVLTVDGHLLELSLKLVYRCLIGRA